MRKVLVTAAAVAPLLAACLAGSAFAACPAGGSATNGANVDLPSGCTVTPPGNGAGITINTSNTVTVESGATISNTEVSNSTGILAQGGNTGTVDNKGTISLLSSFAPTTNTFNGVADGPAFATGVNRYGIHVVGPGTFDGSIINDVGGVITIQGENSAGILIDAPITGDLIDNGTLTLTGDAISGGSSTGIAVNANVGGGVTVGAALSATGQGAQGLVINGATVAGQLVIGNTITATGYRSITAPSDPTTLSRLSSTQLFQGGSAVVVGGSVLNGISLTAAATNVPAGQVIVYGGAPALQIGLAGGAINIGNTPSDPHGLSVGGNISASGVYDPFTSPGLGRQVNATAILLGSGAQSTFLLPNGVQLTLSGASGGSAVNLNGGVSIASTGTVTASARESQAVGIEAGAGTTAGEIANAGTIIATIATSHQLLSGLTQIPATSVGILLDPGANVSTINNAGQLTVTTAETMGNTAALPKGAAIGIIDLSGKVTSINNTGAIKAAVTSSNTAIAPIGPSPVAIDVTALNHVGGTSLSNGVTISQAQAAGSTTAPVISGDILFGAGHNVLNVEAGTVTGAVTELAGQTDLGLNISGGGVLDVTKAETHQLSSLTVNGGTLTAKVDPSFALTAGGAFTPIFDLRQSGGTATLTNAQVGVTLDTVQANPAATYVLVQTNGPGDLTVDQISLAPPTSLPFLYTGETAVSPDGSALDVIVSLKTPAELGLNTNEAQAYNAVIQALATNQALGSAVAAQTNLYGFRQLYDQMLPNQGIGTFDSLDAGTRQVADLVSQPPNPDTRIAGTSFWLQEVNNRVKRSTRESIGSTDKLFGLVGGYEHMGQGGGALGLTIAYLNVEDEGAAQPVGANLVTQIVEAGAYYRRNFGGFGLSLEGAGGYAGFKEKRLFLTTGVSLASHGDWHGFFADAHGSANYEARFGRFFVRPEVDLDYLYLDENAHADTGAGPGFDVALAKRTSSRLSGAALVAFGAQFGHDVWFRPEIFGGYREVVEGHIGDTVASFTGTGGPLFTLTPADDHGGWVTVGFSIKGGTPLSYVAIEGDADYRNSEQRYDVYLAGRAFF
jgi:hypothetical protein